MFLVQNIYFPYNTIKYFEYGQDLAEGSLAEWSKALVLGTSPKGRGFESHRCQICILFLVPEETVSTSCSHEAIQAIN